MLQTSLCLPPSHRHLQCKWLKETLHKWKWHLPLGRVKQAEEREAVMAQPAAESLKSPNRVKYCATIPNLHRKLPTASR